MRHRSFPQGFLWGASTASHQVEGNTINDWSVWEKANAEHLAKASSSQFFAKYPRWQDQFQTEATMPENYLSGSCCDHYHRFEEDFDLVQSLGHSAHRFSIEWSRIEPEEGVFDEAALEHYRKVLQALKVRSITPFVTLWHWTLPLWLTAQGGLASPRFPELFARYSAHLALALGDEVIFWITLNEPDVIASHAYFKGVWPPQKKNIFTYFCVLLHLIDAHKKAYAALKAISPQFQVGIAKHQVVFDMKRPTIINRLLQKIAHFVWNRWLLNRISSYQDFIGLNHYNRNVIDNGFNKNPNQETTDMGWEFFPVSLYRAIMDLTPYRKPIYITENGIADAALDDTLRQRFLVTALSALHQAIAAGADVRGYLYWSLMDNFEWDKGFWPRFGLIHIDYHTKKRTPRQSAFIYQKICTNNALDTQEE